MSSSFKKYLPYNKRHLIWVIPLSIVLLPIILLLIPVIVIDEKRRKKKAGKFWQDNLNKLYFFYSKKHGWGDFVINNFLPALPEETIVVNIHRDTINPLYVINQIIDRRKYPWDSTRLPILVKLNEGTPWVYSFYNEFRPMMKESAKTNIALQEKIQVQLQDLLNHA